MRARPLTAIARPSVHGITVALGMASRMDGCGIRQVTGQGYHGSLYAPLGWPSEPCFLGGCDPMAGICIADLQRSVFHLVLHGLHDQEPLIDAVVCSNKEVRLQGEPLVGRA